MCNNRAMEFITEAFCLLQYPNNYARARIYVEMAMAEVQELIDQIALYECTDGGLAQRIATHPSGGILVENTHLLQPAQLVTSARARAALPDNGRHHE